MSQDTCVMITSMSTTYDTLLEYGFSKEFNFEKHDLDELHVGNKLASYARCWTFTSRDISRETILCIIDQFYKAPFEKYEYVIMTIQDDDYEDLEGIYIHPTSLDDIKTNKSIGDCYVN